MVKVNNPTILHCDMNSFFASVELLSYPEYKDKPVAVAGDPAKRSGIILAKNTIASNAGVKTAETIWSALKKSPNLILLPSHYHKYKEMSKKIIEIYYRYTDLVEPFSIDECWLDITNAPCLSNSNGIAVADEIRKIISNELGITLSIGVATNKIYAKMGSNYKKPDATTSVTDENFLSLFGNKHVTDMFFVGKSTGKKLNQIGCKTIADLYNIEKSILTDILGKYGSLLHEYVHGIYSSPVSKLTCKRDVKSIGNSMTFRRNLIREEEVKQALMILSDKVGSRLRKENLFACGIKVDVKSPDFKVTSKQRTLNFSINSTEDIHKLSFNLLKEFWSIGKPIRLLSVTAINLSHRALHPQLSIFDIQNSKVQVPTSHRHSIDGAMDKIKERYGKSIIFYGNMLNKSEDIGISSDDYVINQMLDEL